MRTAGMGDGGWGTNCQSIEQFIPRPPSPIPFRVPARSWSRALCLAAAVLSTTACARLSATFRSFDYGAPVSSHALRQSLATGSFDSALKWTSVEDEGAPGDALLRHLYAGTVAYYAGRYEESAAAMQRAEDLAEARYTRSVSRGALSLVLNDRVLAYEPGATERLMVHYYGAQAYLRADSFEGAVVEVRRMMHLLERYEEAGTPVHAPTRAALHYFAAAVFEAAGERNDASVAYRDAAAAAGDSTLLPPAPPRAARRTRRVPSAPAAAATGEVVVIVERGFVAEKVERSLAVSLESDEV
ncbi:MAG TPA: hypothetical protein VKA84_23945, partial [Gemmatimonadaceae bacterium]|nr:hypothetical protein [Gemmatimonadaceae bacterium]